MVVARADRQGPRQRCGTGQNAPGHGIKLGDVVTIALDQGVKVLKVTAFSERRGNAEAGQQLYVDVQKLAE